MKRLLFILVVIISINVAPVMAQSSDRDSQIYLYDPGDGGIKVEDDEPDGPINRSLVQCPIYAYLKGQRIMLDFVRTFPWVTVTVTSETTGETIYQSTDSYPATLFIDLNGASRGDYRIDIVIEDASWEGYFLL